ncbi:WhiB family transcriptional regulator [Streptomyces sp. BH097]|uniref:WhiB family transcriptional regulator n=1 Tax=unclassified Streptomyces TaxID=2593676 RepID=UPI003BB6853D
MSGPRTGSPTMKTVVADSRIPFPATDTPPRCQADWERFAIEDVTDYSARKKTTAKAKAICSGCPIVRGCLKWALANPQLTATGVWAATTARERKALRNDLVRRLGDDWVGVVAEKDRRRREERRAARLAPPTVRESVMAHLELELELLPTRPAPYEPWKEPMTPARQAQNRAALEAALSAKAA